MAFVRIARKGERTKLKVTETQYETKYKKLGYHIIEDEKKENPFTEETEKSFDVVEEKTEQNETDYLETIPLSDMTKEQLLAFAQKHNIDTKKARNVGEARKIIREAIRKERE